MTTQRWVGETPRWRELHEQRCSNEEAPVLMYGLRAQNGVSGAMFWAPV